MASDERKDTEGLTRREREGPETSRRDPFEAAERWLGRSARAQERGAWAPEIEAFQRGDTFIVRVDLPGMKREDVTVEVGDEHVIIQGHRREEREDRAGGYYRSERTYGSFFRSVPLPEGADPESAAASFRDGVLEITIKAPARVATRGRRIQIGEGGKEQQATPPSGPESAADQGSRPTEGSTE